MKPFIRNHTEPCSNIITGYTGPGGLQVSALQKGTLTNLLAFPEPEVPTPVVYVLGFEGEYFL